MKRSTIWVVLCLGAWSSHSGAGYGDEPDDKANAGRETRANPARLDSEGRATLPDAADRRQRKGPGALGLSRIGQSRFGWSWLAGRFDKNRDDLVTAEELPATPDIFVRLDRNWDGDLSSTDFDWAPKGDLGRQRDATFALFKALDEDSDGRLTSEEWQTSFAGMAGEEGFLNDEKLEEFIYRPQARRNRTMRQTNFREQLNIYDWAKPAPAPGDIAPDFELRTPNGDATVKLSSFRGKKPVVLIFGSFT